MTLGPKCYNNGNKPETKGLDMPIAHYRNQNGSIDIRNKRFNTPKRIEVAQAWIREIRKVIPEMPDPDTTDWMVTNFDPTLDIILIEMVNMIGEKCRVGVLRGDTLARKVVVNG